MIIEFLLMIAGVVLLLKGSEWITDASIPLAHQLNTTSVAVGLILVSFLLSLPELLISVSAIYQNHVQIGVGVIFGSIIVNLGLIAGISAILRPLKIPRHIITRDAVFMFVITLVVSLLVLDKLTVTREDGVVFLLLFVPYLVNVYEQEKSMAFKERKKESELITKTLEFTGKLGGAEVVIHNPIVIFLLGTAMLLIGSQLFVNSLISISSIFLIPEILVGITLGSLGPSIPTLVAAIQSVRKGYDELAVTQTIGSNIFTLLVTLGVLSIVHPFGLDLTSVIITIPALIFVTAAFFFLSIQGKISRNAGMLLLLSYFIIIGLEIWFQTLI